MSRKVDDLIYYVWVDKFDIQKAVLPFIGSSRIKFIGEGGNCALYDGPTVEPDNIFSSKMDAEASLEKHLNAALEKVKEFETQIKFSLELIRHDRETAKRHSGARRH